MASEGLHPAIMRQEAQASCQKTRGNSVPTRSMMLLSSCAAFCKPMPWEPWAWEGLSRLTRTSAEHPLSHLCLVDSGPTFVCLDSCAGQDAIGPSSKKRSYTAIRDWGPQAPQSYVLDRDHILGDQRRSCRCRHVHGFTGMAVGSHPFGTGHCLAARGCAPREAASLG